jgi:hypothetical protein
MDKETYHSHGPIHHDDRDHSVLEHHTTVKGELLCHFPYAIFSVALTLIVLSFLPYTPQEGLHSHDSLAYRLFHNFHYLHLLFAGTGSVLMFRRYSKNTILGLLVGFFVPAFFCTLSDAMLPYLAGLVLDLDMHFHWCFIAHLDSVLPFLLVGILNGWVMSSHHASRQLFYSIGFHFFHIFISSMASILYLVSFGFHNWWSQIGFVFMFMIVAVLIPCTMADIVTPILFAKIRRQKVK